MSIWRILLCIFLPPIAVYDKGIGRILVTLILTIIGWVPGMIAAFVFNAK